MDPLVDTIFWWEGFLLSMAGGVTATIFLLWLAFERIAEYAGFTRKLLIAYREYLRSKSDGNTRQG